jgi:hypothetical protein
MYIKESTVKLIIIVSALVFLAGLFFTIQYLRKETVMATSPSPEVQASQAKFDTVTFQAVLKKFQQ